MTRSHADLFVALLSIAALSGPPSAQGSITPFGTNCGHSGGPSLSWQGSPEPGASATLTVNNLLPGAAGVIAVGLSDSVWVLGPLPYALPTPPFGSSCTLYVSTDLWLTPVLAGSSAALVGALPTGPDDYHLYCQAIVAESSGDFSVSQALDVYVLASVGGTGDVAGTITTSVGGLPVADARVTLFTTDLLFFLEDRSASDGSYGFPGVPAGAYRLGVASPDFDYEESVVAAGGGTSTIDFALEPESHPGAWAVVGTTAPETLDATDIGVLRPDGTIFYCHDTSDPILFDPVSGTSSVGPDSGTGQGCMNSTLLASGAALLCGGQDGADPGSFMNAISWVKRFEPADTWVQMPDMLAPTGRWYPGLARLADGSLLVMGGGTAPLAERTDTCEVFNAATETWSWTTSMGSAVEFPPSALLYDGLVLRTWGTEPELYDPAAETWSPTASFNFPDRGYPGHSDHSLIVLSDGRAAAIGVNTATQANASMVEVFDPSSGTWSPGSSPSLRRAQSEVVYLPDGQILVQGGDEIANSSPEPDVLGVVKRTDLYDPVADGWRRVADTLLFREYHAVTLLVPDGRVVTTGGTNIKFSSANPLSANIDAYSPPYLFRGVRPSLSNLSDATPARGQTLSVDVSPATQLTHAVLMGAQSTTHWVDGGVPRRLELAVSMSGQQALVTLPTDANLLPLGWYLLFGMVDDIPSEALLVRVDA